MEMIKKSLLLLFLLCSLYHAEDAFEKNCIPCHKKMDISLQKTFMNALLVYGGEKNMKAALTYYFRFPRRDSSVMNEDFLRKTGVKKPISIGDKELSKALDIYWQKYTVIGKLH